MTSHLWHNFFYWDESVSFGIKPVLSKRLTIGAQLEFQNFIVFVLLKLLNIYECRKGPLLIIPFC